MPHIIGLGAAKLLGLEFLGTLYLVRISGLIISTAIIAYALVTARRLTRIIFESTAASKPELYGGRMVVTHDGYLFLTLGDRAERQSAQDLSRHQGSVIRIRTDGSVPDDNPFVFTPSAQPEIWSKGHRNSQGLAIDANSGQLWSHEHGPKGGDELNLILPGHNYGWPVITHGAEYSGSPIGEGREKEGMEQPIHYWSPAIAPSGLAIHSNGGTTRFWIGALIGEAVVSIDLNDGVVRERRLFERQLGRVCDVRIGPDHLLHVLTDGPAGALYRFTPALEEVHRRTDQGG